MGVTMEFKFYATEDTGNKCQWCRNNIGKDGFGWTWELDQGRTVIDSCGYQKHIPTNVIIYIDEKTDAMAFKLRWL